MTEAVCQGCGCSMDISNVEPFTLCECENCGTKLVIPKIIGDLQLETPIGETEFLELYEGYDAAKNMEVEIWTLKKDIEDYDKWLKVAKDEAITLETLKHKNLTPVSYGIADDIFYVTEPLMDGNDLTKFEIQAETTQDMENAIDFLQILVLALAYAHHKEFPHHNICPETIHIDARGVIRVKHFFVSRFTYMVECELKKPFSVSKYYISPEKLEKGAEDKMGDVFSFGVLAYYMLSGQYPFDGKTSEEILYTRVKRKPKDEGEIFSISRRSTLADIIEYRAPVPLSELRPQVSSSISNLIASTLMPYPVQRPKFTEIIDAINLFKAAQEQLKLSQAKRSLVRLPDTEGGMTHTRALPLMENLAEMKTKMKKKPKRKFFKL